MDAILGLFNNPIVLMAAGLVVQFVPGVRKAISNTLIPYLTTVLAFLSSLLAPQAAHAAGGPVAHMAVVMMPTFGLGGILAGLGGAILQSAQGYLLQRMFAWPGKIMPALPADSK
jgi:hypothetical protein